jgi:hypothetical protein
MEAINKRTRNEYMNSFSEQINDIYLKLKNKDFTDLLKYKDIENIVKEIKKNEFSEAQLYVLAKLLCYLINNKKIDKQLFIYPPRERFNQNKMKEYWEKLTEKNLNNLNNLNKSNLNSRIQGIVNNIVKKRNINKEKRIDIILRFIDEFIEVSKFTIFDEYPLLKKTSSDDIYNIKKYLDNMNDISLTLVLIISKYNFDQNKINFLNKLFTYIGESIEKIELRNVLAYIIYLLVKDDIIIPPTINNGKNNFEKVTLTKELEELLKSVDKTKQIKMRRLFHLLQQEKMKKLKSIKVDDSSFVPDSNANSNKSPEEYIKTTLDNLSKNNDIATALTLIVSKFLIKDLNKINFLQELFEYVLDNIKEKHIIDILTYIVYSLVIDDKNIPAKIPAKITEKFEKLIANTNNLNSESKNKFSKFSKQFERNFILNRLLYILFKLLPKKESSYKYSTPRPPRPPSYSNPSSSSNSKNYLNNLKNYDSINTTDPRSFLAEIKRRINAITQERRDIFVQNLIDSILKDNISKNILRIFPDFNMFRLPLFLSKLFGYFSDEFLKDKTIKKILTYIVYSLINTDLNINNVDHLPLDQKLEDILMEIFEVNTQIPEILIKLFKILTKRIEELE